MTETCWASPSTSRVVRVKGAPSWSSTRPQPKARMRISGPLVSKMVATGRPRLSLTRLNRVSRAPWVSWVPWEKLKRAASMPDRMSCSMTSSLSDAGPRVQTIFVFLMLATSCLGKHDMY